MSTTETQLPLDLGQREAFGREDFLIAPCNEAVIAWLDRWPDWPGHGLIVHGPAGCGKTHLAHVFKAVSGARLLKGRNLSEETGSYEAARHVIVEDVDKGVDEAALLHLYNATVERGGSILVTAAGAPGAWRIGLPDLRSRLNALGSVEVGLPDDTLLAAVLVKLLADRQLKVGNDVVMYLVRHMERSFQAARRTVGELDEASLAVRREITIPLARQILGRHQNSEGE